MSCVGVSVTRRFGKAEGRKKKERVKKRTQLYTYLYTRMAVYLGVVCWEERGKEEEFQDVLRVWEVTGYVGSC